MEWINIRDNIPNEGQKVIYYFVYCGVARGKYKRVHEDDFGDFNCFYGEQGWLCDDVTHWMPDDGGRLPLPPKEENGKEFYIDR